MMLLGQVLDRLGDESVAAETLLGLDDLPLMVDVEATGARFGESPPLYASNAVGRFTAFASDEDWLALMTALERTSDPAAACLRQMLLWSLRQDSHADCDADHECCNHRS
ncbi:hypothetical protein [Reyranella sp.]|jgi:hypothetical protein|uniref:hypothetical protein n=1 Tax=Reyranella sp. TaxID=1929291 RepID=UPI003C7E13B7